MVAVSGAVPVLMAVNAGIFPNPAAARPMAVLELTQLYTVPGTFPEKVTVEVDTW